MTSVWRSVAPAFVTQYVTNSGMIFDYNGVMKESFCPSDQQPVEGQAIIASIRRRQGFGGTKARSYKTRRRLSHTMAAATAALSDSAAPYRGIVT